MRDALTEQPRVPRISVVTVCLNSVGTIAEALDSVASQAGADVEHIVIDGASTDDTAELLESRRAQLATLVRERVWVFNYAMNKGIALATGDAVGFLNADDAYEGPDVLARIAATFADARVDACLGDLVYVETGRTWPGSCAIGNRATIALAWSSAAGCRRIRRSLCAPE